MQTGKHASKQDYLFAEQYPLGRHQKCCCLFVCLFVYFIADAVATLSSARLLSSRQHLSLPHLVSLAAPLTQWTIRTYEFCHDF